MDNEKIIYIIDSIGREPQYDKNGNISCYTGTDPQDVIYQINNYENSNQNYCLRFQINSNGGDAQKSWTIVQAIANCKNHTRTEGIGMVISAAGNIFQAGKERIMKYNATMMLHYARVVEGNDSDGANEWVNALNNMTETILEKRSKLDMSEIKSLLKKETYLTALECLKMGLCDSISLDDFFTDLTNDENKVANQFKNFIANQNKQINLKQNNIMENEILLKEIKSLKASQEKMMQEKKESEDKTAEMEAKIEKLMQTISEIEKGVDKKKAEEEYDNDEKKPKQKKSKQKKGKQDDDEDEDDYVAEEEDDEKELKTSQAKKIKQLEEKIEKLTQGLNYFAEELDSNEEKNESEKLKQEKEEEDKKIEQSIKEVILEGHINASDTETIEKIKSLNSFSAIQTALGLLKTNKVSAKQSIETKKDGNDQEESFLSRLNKKK